MMITIRRRIVNVTPHSCCFMNMRRGTVYDVPPSGVVLSATPVEVPVGTSKGVTLVRTTFKASSEALEMLARIERENPGAIVVGSLIAAQAFPGRVYAVTPVPGYERVAPAEKRMRDDKFTVF